MHYLSELTLRVAFIYGGIIGGFLLQKWSKAEKAGKWLLFVGLNILTPVLLILVFLDLDTENFDSSSLWYIVLIVSLGMLVSMVIDWVLLRKKELTNAQKGAEINATGFMNALFYPFPIIVGILPAEMRAQGLLAASLYLIVQSIYRNSFGVFLGIHYGSAERKPLLKIVKELILFPPTLGMIAGLILRFTIGRRPTSEFLAANVFQDITMVIMLIIVGLGFKFPKKGEWKEIALFRGITARFGGGLVPVVIILFLPILISTKVPLIIQSMAPPAVANSAYSKYFNLDEVLTSRYIALLTLVALLFLPIEIVLLVWWIS
jgi:predicted permease